MIIHPVDRDIPVQISDATFYIRPLTIEQRIEVMDIKKGGKDPTMSGHEMVVQALRMALKRAEGLRLSDGSEYKIKFDSSGKLNRQCAEALLNASTELMMLSAKLPHGVVDTSIDGIKVGKKKKKK